MPSFPLASPESGRASTVYGMFISGALRLELRGEVLRGSRHAVLVRTAIHDRLGQEIAVAGRRRRRPLERGGLPRILVDRGAPLVAHEEVANEDQLEQAEAPRRVALHDVP